MSQKPSRERGERRYTSAACLSCRKRKVKCNNEQPKCSNCVLYESDCVYGQDRRRASTSVVQSQDAPTNDGSASFVGGDVLDKATSSNTPLASNIRQNFAQGQPFHPLAHPLDSQQIGSDFLQSTGNDWAYWASPNETVHFFPNAGLDPDHNFPPLQITDQDGFRQDPCLDAFHVDSDTPETSPASQAISPGIPVTAGAQPDSTSSRNENVHRATRLRTDEDYEHQPDAVNDVTKQLTSRLGRLQIAEDGRPRYYGATSNLHLLYSGAGSLTQPNIRTVLTHGVAAIASAGLEWEADQPYESHLINLFFSWHNNLQFPVDKVIFLRERERFYRGASTDLFTPSLENAILCIGSAYTDRYHPNIKDSADEFFALRTKAYLDIEIDSPSIATAQALLILSSHEAAHTRESRGWIYMGMATQIITDLGLHLDLEQEYTHLETDSNFQDVNIIRRNVFWTVKSTDILWSAYSGRPSMMKNLVHNQKNPLPSRTYHWECYTDEHTMINFPPDFDSRAAAYVHVHLASLTLILARVSEVLYSGVPDMLNDIQAFVATADTDFRAWLAALPTNVRLDLSQPFHVQGVMELHLIYHESIILLHRPLMTPSEPLSVPGLISDRESAAFSLGRCIESAHKICQILVHYRNRYGLKRLHHQMVHAAMTAALIHAFQLCTTSLGTPENKTAQTSFLTCIQALGEMGQTFKSASRALEVVTSLRQAWRDDASAGDRFKRARLH